MAAGHGKNPGGGLRPGEYVDPDAPRVPEKELASSNPFQDDLNGYAPNVNFHPMPDIDVLLGGNAEHEVYLDGKRLPQTPAKITYEYADQTEVIRLANEGNLTLPRKEAPLKISFDFVCTSEYYPYTHIVGYARKRWTDFLWSIKQEKRPVDFEVVRHHSGKKDSATFDVSMRVLVTDWQFNEDAEQDDDFTISITLMEYFEQRNLEIDHDVQHHLIQNRKIRGWATSGGR